MPKKIEYKKRKLLGLCVDCSADATNGVYCEKCRIRHMADNKKRKEHLSNNGLCIICSASKEQIKKNKCNSCLKKFNTMMINRKNERINNKLCINCNVKSKIKRCNTCYLKMISINVFGTSKKYRELEELFNKQNKKCTYSGRTLALQENCELDHILPHALNGTNEIDNLQWLHRDINKMKYDMDENTFIKTIIEIANHKSLISHNQSL